MFSCTNTHTHTHIYIYRHSEREREDAETKYEIIFKTFFNLISPIFEKKSQI